MIGSLPTRIRKRATYRKASKLASTYGAAWLENGCYRNGRIYASWRQLRAATGRMACDHPNLQNIPRSGPLRSYIRASEGRVFVSADYSQIELRIAAKISGDTEMLNAYAQGRDLHTLTAQSLTGREDVSKDERKLAKAVNFGLLYRMGTQGLQSYAQRNYGVEMSFEEAALYRRRFFSWLSPASRASWICSLMFPLWSSISSWAKYRPCCCCSVTSHPSPSQPYEGPAALLSRSSVALPRAQSQPIPRAPVPLEALRPTPSSKTFGMWPACHRRPSLARRFQSRTIAAVPNPHATRATMAIASSSWLTMDLLFPLGTSVASRCPCAVKGQ
jgi:hypothetical protein